MKPAGIRSSGKSVDGLPDTRLFAQSQHVLHVEQAALPGREKSGGTQRALRESCTAARPVGNLDAFACSCKHHRVITDDVSASHRGKADCIAARSPVTPWRP